ncbi:MAG: glycosyltransferase family 1 protein [Anaerolineales bacterium]|nr:glycosyltransferase family 1 protein [Anaerolineales bacterium]
MRTFFLTSGTRGDVQISVAAAHSAQAAGLEATVAAPPAFRAVAGTYGVPFAEVPGNPSDLFARGSAPEFAPGGGLRASLAYLKAARPVYAHMLTSAWHACQSAEMLIISLPTLWCASIAEKLGIPCVALLAQPLTRTRHFPSALWPGRVPQFFNSLTHRLVEWALWLPWRGVVNAWRARTLGLPPLTSLMDDLLTRRVPFVYAFGSALVPRPADWPAHHTLAGFCWLPETPQPLPPTLEEFLAAGPPPVYIGLGSMGSGGAHLLIEEAVAQAGVRAIVPLESGCRAGKDILPVSEVAHAQLFPRLAAVAHHGGIGTLANTLRAGVPHIILPVASDQFFWAERLKTLGVATHTLPRHTLTAPALAQALSATLSNAALRHRAQSLAPHFAAEAGAREVVGLLERQ